MDFEPDYTRYTRDELVDARDHVDREKYPQRAAMIDQEIARRPASSSESDRPLTLKEKQAIAKKSVVTAPIIMAVLSAFFWAFGGPFFRVMFVVGIACGFLFGWARRSSWTKYVARMKRPKKVRNIVWFIVVSLLWNISRRFVDPVIHYFFETSLLGIVCGGSLGLCAWLGLAYWKREKLSEPFSGK